VPAFALSAGDIVACRKRADVVEALVWTANGEAEPGSVERSLASLLAARAGLSLEGALWFGGHRPVAGRYALRAGGRYVQFHEIGARRAVLLLPGRAPDPDRDILDPPCPGGAPGSPRWLKPGFLRLPRGRLGRRQADREAGRQGPGP